MCLEALLTSNLQDSSRAAWLKVSRSIFWFPLARERHLYHVGYPSLCFQLQGRDRGEEIQNICSQAVHSLRKIRGGRTHGAQSPEFDSYAILMKFLKRKPSQLQLCEVLITWLSRDLTCTLETCLMHALDILSSLLELSATITSRRFYLAKVNGGDKAANWNLCLRGQTCHGFRTTVLVKVVRPKKGSYRIIPRYRIMIPYHTQTQGAILFWSTSLNFLVCCLH